MCGIVGYLGTNDQDHMAEEILRQMLAMVRHRGPDQYGIYLDDKVGLGSARLNIVDLSTGQQPIANEDETLWIVFNGEIYNYPRLRKKLKDHGHIFTTKTDTEVILHLYEDHGPACLNFLNGQFAIAIWDSKKDQLFLARDRLGIRPLFYTQLKRSLIFGSEIKSILAYPGVRARLDPISLHQIFTFWSALTPRTAFWDITEIPPGHYLLASPDGLNLQRYYQLRYPDEVNKQPLVDFLLNKESNWPTSTDYLDAFRSLLVDATQIRLRADVPVGAYLSGGIDSSIISAIIRKYSGNRLDTFSIAFSDPDFDESEHQRSMAEHLGTDHHVIHATHEDIGNIFPEVIWHTETPIMRTSPAPLYLLSKLVQDHGYKVVLTGEGADEFLAGYNIFKEAKVRRFWAKYPNSEMRPMLLQRLYPFISDLSKGSRGSLEAFFKQGLSDIDARDYSHAIRWRNNARSCRFFSDELKEISGTQTSEIIETIPIPQEFRNWHPLHRAQYLEITIFMSQYLLSSQGDRVSMAHSVEGRFPYLDHRVIEFCNYLPPDLKLLGLCEKILLRKLAKELLPDEILTRPKQPYRAPIHRSFFNGSSLKYVGDLLSGQMIKDAGLFNPQSVSGLVRKIMRGMPLSETDDMALAGILSTQLVYQLFVNDFQMPTPISAQDDVKVCRGN